MVVEVHELHLLEKASFKCVTPFAAVRSPGEPYIEDDVAYSSDMERNADPCTSRGCMWPKSSNGYVYVPYTISAVYSK